jgi:hypothetical protein
MSNYDDLIKSFPKIKQIIIEYFPRVGRWLHNIALKSIEYKNNLPDYYIYDTDNIEPIKNVNLYKSANYLIKIMNIFRNYKSYDFWEDNVTEYDDFDISIGKLEDDIVLKVDTEYPLSAKLYIEYSKKYIDVLSHVIAKEIREEKAQLVYSVLEQKITTEIAHTGYDGGYSYSSDEIALRASILAKNYEAMKEIAKEFNIKMVATDWTVILHACEDDDYEMSAIGIGKTYEDAYKNAEDAWDDANSDITDDSEFEQEIERYQEGLEEPIVPKEIDVSYWSKTNPSKPPIMPSLPNFWIRHAHEASKTDDGKKLNEMIEKINKNIKNAFIGISFDLNHKLDTDLLLERAISKREEIMKLMPELKEVGDKFYKTFLYNNKYPKMDDWEEHQKDFINTWWKYVNMSSTIPHPEVFFNDSHTYRLTDYIDEYKIWEEATMPLRPVWNEYLKKKEIWDEASKAARDDLTYNRHLANDIKRVEDISYFTNIEEEKEKVQNKIYQKKRFGYAEEFYAVPTTFTFGNQSNDKSIKKLKIKFKVYDID